MALQCRISCELTAFVPLLQHSVPASLGRLGAAAAHRILVSCAAHCSVDGVATGPGLVKACTSFHGCFSCPRPMRSLSLSFFCHISRYANAQCAFATKTKLSGTCFNRCHITCRTCWQALLAHFIPWFGYPAVYMEIPRSKSQCFVRTSPICSRYFTVGGGGGLWRGFLFVAGCCHRF